MTDKARRRQTRPVRKSSQHQGAPHTSALHYNKNTAAASALLCEDYFDPHPVSDFNWTRPDRVLALQTHHSLHERYLLKLIDDRITRYPYRFGTSRAHEDNYRKKASLIALSDAHFRDRFCHCSIPNSRNPAGICGFRRFCPYCNHHIREGAQMTYVPAFRKGNWYFCTLSFHGHVSLEGDEAGLGLYWDACNAAIQVLISEGYIHGAYWSEELSVRELCPFLSVLPHAHAVLHCRNGSALNLKAVHEFLEGFMQLYLEVVVGNDRDLDDIASQLLLPPSVQLQPLPTQRDLLFAVGYVTKTIKLVGAYEAAVDALEPSEVWRVNSQLNLFFEGFDLELLGETQSGRPWNRRQLFRSGTLLSQSKSFVGTPRSKRTSYSDRRRLRKFLIEVMKQPSQWSASFDDILLIESSIENDLNDEDEID